MPVRLPTPGWVKPEELLNDEYWKLGVHDFLTIKQARDTMAKRKFHCPKSRLKVRVIDLLRRMKRGLISYEGCSLAELQRFVGDRRIAVTDDDLHVERALVQALEDADDHATFDQFSDLPPELRTRIYAKSFEDFDLPLCPTQPPVSKVSRLLRSEALPLFYSMCMFKVRVYRVPNSLGRDRWGQVYTNPAGNFNIRLDPKTAEFFKTVTETYVKRIRNLNVRLHSKWDSVRFGWDLKLGSEQDHTSEVRTDEETVEELARRPFHMRGPEKQEVLDKITLLFEQTAGTVSARPTAHKLLKQDIESFKAIFEAVAPKMYLRFR